MAGDRFAVGMVDHKGKTWKFTGDWAAGITSGGVDGLVGSTEDVTAQALSGVGQVVLSQRMVPIQGQLKFNCRADGKRDAGQVAADLRAAFSPMLGRENQLGVSSPLGVAEALVRLSGPIPDPVEDPSWDEEVVLGVQVPVVADGGLWWLAEQSGTGLVTVTNKGDVPVPLKIRWQGAGGVVVMQSGARLTLPEVPAPRTIWLSREHSLAVRDDRGVMDRKLWKQLRAALPELVPAGASRRVTVPEGAEVMWREGVLDPWR